MMHCPKVDVDQLYVTRRDSGKGSVQLELTYGICYWFTEIFELNYILDSAICKQKLYKQKSTSQIKTKNLSTNCESVMKKVVKKEARAKRINSKEFFGKKTFS